MSHNTIALIALAIVFSWNSIVFGTCAYVVFWLGHSGWWFLLAMIIAGGMSDVVSITRAKRP